MKRHMHGVFKTLESDTFAYTSWNAVGLSLFQGRDMERDKPFQTISELIALLKSRELHIEDEIQHGDFNNSAASDSFVI